MTYASSLHWKLIRAVVQCAINVCVLLGSVRYYPSMSVITINGTVIKSPSCVPRLSAVMNVEHVIRPINHPLSTVHLISGRIRNQGALWDPIEVYLSRNAFYKDVNTKHPDLVLSSADTLIRVRVSPFTKVGMHFLHQIKFTLYFPITTNIQLSPISRYIGYNWHCQWIQWTHQILQKQCPNPPTKMKILTDLGIWEVSWSGVPCPQMKIWPDLNTGDLSWSGVPSPPPPHENLDKFWHLGFELLWRLIWFFICLHIC